MTDHETTEIIDVFLDEGSNGLKMMWTYDEEICRDFLPSRVVQDDLTKGDGSYCDEAYKADGDVFTVAPFADGALPTDTRGYQTSVYNRVLVHEALRRNGFGGKQVRITVTLPVGDFYAVKPRNNALIDKKKKNLMEPVENLLGHQLAEIVDVKISPEAIPAWMNYVLDEKGEQITEADASHRIFVVDQGGTTTDFAIIDGFGTIHRSDSVRAGGFNVADNLRPLLASRFNRKNIETHLLDRAMKEGKFAGEDITQEIEQACKPVERQIFIGMEQFSPDSGAMDAVLYVGGLSRLTANRLSARYGGNTIKGNEFTIVQGITKQAIHQQKTLKRMDNLLGETVEHAED